MLKNLKIENKKILLVLSSDEKDYKTFLSARNLDNVLVTLDTDIMLDDLLNSDSIIMSEEIAKGIEGRLA